MQTSGTFPGLSDGVKKTVTPAAPRAVPPKAPRVDRLTPGDIPDGPRPSTPVKPAPSSHRAGGHAKHTRRSR